MFSVIAAHCKNIDIWQIFSLLNNEVPIYFKSYRITRISYLGISDSEFYHMVERTGNNDYRTESSYNNGITIEYHANRLDLYSYTNNLRNQQIISYLFGELYQITNKILDKSSHSYVRHGEFILYDRGKLYQKKLFKNGIKEGKEIEYYKNGSIMSEKFFNRGDEIGSTVYYENGKVKNYVYDDTTFIYNDDGIIIDTITYY